MSCICCPALRPKYKRLVDNIFPHSSSDGLVRSEMEKLTFYAVSAPEKLDRIGDYLARRLTRDMHRKREGFVLIAMEALNQLLLACHAQQINLFVESFLKMVASLLESDNQEFQSLGTNSFEKFSKIEEDTASYHRRYDFFISKFSSMCHSNQTDVNQRKRMQMNGVRGLGGVVRKTVSDELQVNIWESQHMDKIIPSLMYIMQTNLHESQHGDGSPVENLDKENPGSLAEESLRELFAKSAFANVPAAISPALRHIDDHKLWAPDNTFAVECFKVIMYSIQGQYSHVAVKMLLDHLDNNNKEPEDVKASMLQVLCAIVPIPSSTSIGPSVIDVFNRLSHHLKSCAEKNQQGKFVDALVETTKVLAGIVPDYQKLETMSFYVNKAYEAVKPDGFSTVSEIDRGYADLLLKCLQGVSKTYHCSNLSSLSSTLMDPLLKIGLITEPSRRAMAQRVLISLLDKNKNEGKLFLVEAQAEIEAMGVTSSTIGKYDADFLDRRLPSIYHWLLESLCLDDNNKENFKLLYQCICVVCLSLVSPEVITELVRILLTAQEVLVELLSTKNIADSEQTRILYGLSVFSSAMLILSHLSAVPEFEHYVNQVMVNRKSQGNVSHVKNIFTSSSIFDALKGRSGFAVDKLNQPILSSFHADTISADYSRSAVDVESINIEFMETVDGSTTTESNEIPASAITFDYLKQHFLTPPLTLEEQHAKCARKVEHIKTVPFEQLISEMTPDPVEAAHSLLQHLLEMHDLEDKEDVPLVFPDFMLI